MLGLTREYLQILRSVVGFVTVDVVDYFARFQRATEHLLCHGPVLVPAEVLAVGLAFAPLLHSLSMSGAVAILILVSGRIALRV